MKAIVDAAYTKETIMNDLTRYINLGCRHMSICDSVEKDTTLQDIADAYGDLKNAEAHPVDDSHVRKMRECLDYRLDALEGTNK